jgi:glycosyltransferase involved in cell wall biosynthesis
MLTKPKKGPKKGVRLDLREAPDEPFQQIQPDTFSPPRNAAIAADRCVSLIIPTYNSAATLPRAVQSVVRQTLRDWELIVVDDGSTDQTPELCHDYAQRLGDRLVWVRTENRGAGAARNVGIELSRGRYVAFLDADDELMPDRLMRQVSLMEACGDLGLVFSNYAYVDVEGRLHASVFDDLVPFIRKIPTMQLAGGGRICGPELLERMTCAYIVSTITGMVRRAVLGADVRFPRDLCYCEEWLFFLEVCRRTRGGYIDAPLALHYHTPGSLSRSSVQRNLEHRIRALEWIQATAGAVSSCTRRALRRQLAEAHRQLGYDDYKSGKFDEAADHFWHALRASPGIRPAVNVVQALLRAARNPHRTAPA